MTGKFENKVVVVTGGTSGIGFATTKRFAAEGASVFITGRRQEELDAAVRTIGGRVSGVRADMSKLADIEALADTASPMHGTDTKGPTAMLKSVSKLPTVLVSGGQLFNMKLTPSSIEKPGGRQKFIAMIRSFLGDLKGMHVQFNIVDAELLRKAQEHPEQHKDLMVRVAGYSALFAPLDKNLQNDIIARTEHAL